ncbi:MAG: PHP domain-containing protein [bacterium]
MSNSSSQLPQLVESGGVDLHTHSTSSDGQFTPARLVELAEEAGLEALALTDHDTVGGIEEFMRAGENSPVETVPGLEISCENKKGRFHILGYYLDWEKPVVAQELKYYEEARAERVRGMIEILQDETETDLTFEKVATQAGKNLIGKPHVAQAMVEEGLVANTDEAFENYLASGQVLDQVPKERMGVRQAVQLIKSASGVPVLAHPVLYPQNLDVVNFKGLGIEGVEVYYSDNEPEDHRRYLEFARKKNLLVTGGSDFHGEVKPEVKLGDIRVDISVVEALQGKSLMTGGRYDFY